MNRPIAAKGLLHQYTTDSRFKIQDWVLLILIGTSWYGVLPFALFLPAGMLAVKYKPKPEEEPEVLYGSDGSPVR